MESQAARITRYVILAVFLCLLWGGAAVGIGFAGWLAMSGPPSPMVLSLPLAAIASSMAGWYAWNGLHRLRKGYLTSFLIYVALACPMIHGGVGLWLANRGTPHIGLLPGTTVALGLVFALAFLAVALAWRERRRRLRLASAAG